MEISPEDKVRIPKPICMDLGSRGFFYGACKVHIIGLGGILVIVKSLTIIFRANSGSRMNNERHSLALRVLMKIALEENIKYFYVFGDYELCVAFMNKNKQIFNINLQGIGNKLK